MAIFNFKQAIYASMVATAGVDGEVTKKEVSLVEEVFLHYYVLSRKEKKEVIKAWKNNKESFVQIVIDELRLHTVKDRKEAYKRVCQFIFYRKKGYNMSGKKLSKGIDKDKLELNMYDDLADEFKKALFSKSEDAPIVTESDAPTEAAKGSIDD